MPTLIVVGQKDGGTPPEHVKQLFDVLPDGKKEYHVIPNAPHTFRSEEDLAALKAIFDTWLAKLTI